MKILLIIIMVMLTEFIFPQSTDNSVQQFANIGDLCLENGSVIKDCKIGYRVFGKLNEGKNNVIVFPTWFSGTSKDVANLIGTNGLLDSAGYYIIIIDALGNGISSSPSNSPLQKDSDFPVFSIKDMVNSQYIFLTKYLNLQRIYAIVGGSMGGMQVFQWIVSYPDFMQKAVPYLGTPFRSSYDLLLNKIQMELIESGIKNNLPAKEINYQLNLLLNLVAKSPEWLSKNINRKDFKSFAEKLNTDPSKTYTLYNYLSQLKAMFGHDIFNGNEFNNEILKVIKAKLLIIVSKEDHIVQPYHTINFADLIKADLYIINSDCGHLAVNCDLKNVREKIQNFLNNDQ